MEVLSELVRDVGHTYPISVGLMYQMGGFGLNWVVVGGGYPATKLLLHKGRRGEGKGQGGGGEG